MTHTNYEVKYMQNHLKNQTSPYLLQHANNPVDWYPWCEEAFEKAKQEDKPVFLSIGYSTCHWCHVMAHECFDDEEIARLLNQDFISIKVDKEERPDIDSIYMSVCQALTGNGGWPTTIFMTPEQKPFFAGTYFPKTSRFGSIGFMDLITTIDEKWKTDRKALVDSAEGIVEFLKENSKQKYRKSVTPEEISSVNFTEEIDADYMNLLNFAAQIYRRIFDEKYGGFGVAPKFPSPHNLLFLMHYFEKSKEQTAMDMVNKTLVQMYRGGIYDHIGGGFSRYSTDVYYLVPHFEKMLYDNAMLIMTYCKAYELTGNMLYQGVAEKTANFIINEVTSPRGGFYSAQDADSEGVEGRYYLFEPKEIKMLLGAKDGDAFCRYFDITDEGNFEGKNIPNLLKNSHITAGYNAFLPTVYEYRKERYHLHLDDKILTSWNGLMIGAMCYLYRITKNETYLGVAEQAQGFIENKLCKEDTLFVSWREGECSGQGFLDDYANEIFALVCLYEASLDKSYLEKAQIFAQKVIHDFYDEKAAGFFLTGKDNESLILRPKETYDGAVPSGNSMMAYNLVRLSYLTRETTYREMAQRQLAFLYQEAKTYPAGYAMFLTALLDYLEMPDKVIVVVKDKKDLVDLPCRIPLNMLVSILDEPTKEYPLKDDKTTYYVCKGHSCTPPTNELKLSLGE